jgi:hypothetical protein
VKFNNISSADENKYKILMYSLYFKTIKIKYINSLIEDSEVVLVLNIIMQV